MKKNRNNLDKRSMLYIEMGPNSDKCKICSSGANTDKEHILNEKKCWKKMETTKERKWNRIRQNKTLHGWLKKNRKEKLNKLLYGKNWDGKLLKLLALNPVSFKVKSTDYQGKNEL